MHTVDLLDEALRIAAQLGYRVRQEWLGGSGGGACEFNGSKWIFLDLALASSEQLEQVVEALRGEPMARSLDVSQTLRSLLAKRKAA